MPNHEPMNMLKIVNGVTVPMTAAEIADRNTQIEQIVVEDYANGYKIRRLNEYPSTAEQLDQIYHEGLQAWMSAIKCIKDKHPKQ